MNQLTQKRNEILNNELKLISSIKRECCEQNHVKTIKENNIKIQEYHLQSGMYVYALNNTESEYKDINEIQNFIVSPAELREISGTDFGKEDYFSTIDSKKGYTTNIETGIWKLMKENEIRYTIKNKDKKIAVIQIKKNNENSIDKNVFSYYGTVEKKINHILERYDNILDLINEISSEKNIQNELCSNEYYIENKSLKSLINEFTLYTQFISIENNTIEDSTNKIDEVNMKIVRLQQKYKRISNVLSIETQNMKYNVNKTNKTSNNLPAVIKNQNGILKTVKAWAAIRKLARANLYERQKMM